MRDAIALLALLSQPNVRGWLRLIRAGESSQDDDAYRWLFGSTRKTPKLFDSYADHPRVRTYEAYDGQFIKNGKIDYTTAAGAYQITETTWNGVSKRLGLTDFSPRSQDIAALALTEGRGALEAVLAGTIERAMFLCRHEWASLPHSDYGQPTQSSANALRIFQQYAVADTAALAPAPVAAAPAPAPDIAAAPAEPGTQWPFPPASTPNPAQTKESAMPIPAVLIPAAASFIGGLARNLFDAFTPLAREKLTKEMDKHTNDPDVAMQIANGVIDSVKSLTGKSDPIEAIAVAKADPVIIQQVETDALANLERLAPMLDKMHQWERDGWSASESSMEAAAARARLEAHDQDVFLTRSIVGMVGALMLGLAIMIWLLVHYKASDSIIGTVLGLFSMAVGIVAGEFKTRYQHRYGSSRSSVAKDAVIGELSRRP